MKSVIFDNMVCKVMPTVTHKLQKQHQKLIHKNKNRILIVNGDNPDSHAILKLDLERNGFIVRTYEQIREYLENYEDREKTCSREKQVISV